MNVSTSNKMNCLFSKSAEMRWLSLEFRPLKSVDACSYLLPSYIFLGAGKRAGLVWKEVCTQVSMSFTELNSLFGYAKDPQPINNTDRLKFITRVLIFFFYTCSRF